MNSVTGIPILQNYFDNLSFNPVFLIIVIVIIVLYFILFGYLGGISSNPDDINTSSTSTEVTILGIILITLFIVLVIINGFNHFLNIDIVTTIRDFFSRTPEIDIHVNNIDNNDNNGNNNNSDVPVPEIKGYQEVYHIPGNEYTYNNARALCKAYNGRLATYKEIEDAYNDGGEWCSYGWSDNQLALFPTQYKTWKTLQSVDGHENDCGRPGINGGFIDNPSVRFGVNCYGHKPKKTPLEAKLMKNNREFPVTKQSLQFQEKVDYWRSVLKNILVSPFNRKRWSRL